MISKRVKRRSDCPHAYALDIFGDRWTLLVIRDLMFNGKRRYGEFLEAEEGIATNILADRLSRLEACGIISSSPDPDDGRRRIYSLTSKGADLAPLMLEMIVWSAKHDPQTGVSKAYVRRAKRDREGLLREIASNLSSAE